ncbi:hypothetical protein [Herbidospora mongoliensis]|uniref:hypothetical protein n=1 Tax=Herbidospora mongoliensis TaxID=688067 RepID=UPI000832C94B|nr:hypothetical protein [Herbidospora mongoliensis]
MLRRAFTLLATAALAATTLVATSTPAHAVIVNLNFGPLSIGEYCAAKIHPAAWLGLYEASGLRCYTPQGSGLIFRGTGDPYLACKHLTTDVIAGATRIAGDGISCQAVR